MGQRLSILKTPSGHMDKIVCVTRIGQYEMRGESVIIRYKWVLIFCQILSNKYISQMG